jgi:hypothetical protein
MNKNNLFYFDIETVGQYKDLETLKENDKRGYDLFLKKYEKNASMREGENTSPEIAYLNYSPIFSTYGKIVCISFGYFHEQNENGYTINSLYGDNEEDIMKQAQNLFSKVSKKHLFLSGYNINSFDIPWINHKFNKYGLSLPPVLRIYGKKPWEIQSFDLFNEWKAVHSRFFSSFDEVCYELGIKSPKEKIDGSQVHNTYWNENDLDTIVEYCQSDVYSSMVVAEKMMNGNI